MVLFCHPFIEIKTPLVGSELVRVVLNENALLLADLLYDRGDIILREHPCAFQHMEDLVAPHSLINAAVFFKTDGQHTIEIVATVSGSRETPVWCMIYDSLDYKNEADIFANQMKHVRPLKPYEIFMANIEAGNEQQLVIKRLVESYSLSIGPTKAYGVICAVATLERIYTKYGYHVLDRTLRLCVGTWEGDIDSLGANVLAGVARMVVAFGDQLRDETFKERVGFMSVRQLSRIAKERGAGSLCYAEAMLVAYNRKCKYTLRMTKLHSGKVAAEDDFVEENEEPLADDPVLEE